MFFVKIKSLWLAATNTIYYDRTNYQSRAKAGRDLMKKGEIILVKVGFIACPQCGDMTWETKDFAAAKKGAGVFRDLGPAAVVGYIACAGCPGKRVVDSAKLLIKCGADIIAMSSCMNSTDAGGNACPYYERIRQELSKQLRSTIVIDCRDGVGS